MAPLLAAAAAAPMRAVPMRAAPTVPAAAVLSEGAESTTVFGGFGKSFAQHPGEWIAGVASTLLFFTAGG